MSDKKEIIIFAEDDPSTSKVLRYLLTRDGYQVYNYNSGVGVLEGVKEYRPALLILDIMMPDKDGLTVLREIREVPEIAETPVILLTALKDENYITRSIEYGVADFLIKPFKLSDLSIRVKKIIDISQEKVNPTQIKQTSPEHFKSIVDTLPVLIWEAGVDRQCVYLNKSWLDFTGKSLGGGLVNAWTDSIHKEDITKVIEVRNSAFDSLKKYEIKYRLKHHSGEYRWIVENGTPRFTSDNVFLGVIGSCLDITEQQKMENELKTIYQVVLNVPISVIITDINGVIEYVNPIFSELSGFSYKDSIGKQAEIFKRGELSEEDSIQMWKTILAGKQWIGKVTSKTKNSEKLFERVSVSPIKNDDRKITNFVVYKEVINNK